MFVIYKLKHYICTNKQTNITKNMVTKISVRATLKEMQAGEEVKIPFRLSRYNSVRNCASLLGQDMGRRYSVSVDRTAEQTKVTRLS